MFQKHQERLEGMIDCCSRDHGVHCLEGMERGFLFLTIGLFCFWPRGFLLLTIRESLYLQSVRPVAWTLWNPSLHASLWFNETLTCHSPFSLLFSSPASDECLKLKIRTANVFCLIGQLLVSGFPPSSVFFLPHTAIFAFHSSLWIDANSGHSRLSQILVSGYFLSILFSRPRQLPRETDWTFLQTNFHL